MHIVGWTWKMEPLNKEQIEQATNIITSDMSLNGAIRAWAWGVHGQQKISYVFEDGKVKAKCELCDSSNQWDAGGDPVPFAHVMRSGKEIKADIDAGHDPKAIMLELECDKRYLLHSIFCELQKQTRLLIEES